MILFPFEWKRGKRLRTEDSGETTRVRMNKFSITKAHPRLQFQAKPLEIQHSGAKFTLNPPGPHFQPAEVTDPEPLRNPDAHPSRPSPEAAITQES